MNAAPIWINGRLASTAELVITAFDRGFTLGDGVFETIRAHGIRCLWLEDHLARLRKAASVLAIPIALSDTIIADGIADLLGAAAYEESAVRLTLSRGPSERRGLWPPSLPSTPTLLATVAKLATASTPLRMLISRQTIRNERSPLCRIKSLNYGDNLLARREAIEGHMDDALMLNSAGRLACATVANVFLKIDGRWRTPTTSEGALPGLARHRLLRILDVDETTITPFNIAQVSVGFLSNSLSISPIHDIDGRSLDGADGLPASTDLFRSQ
jgi:branched-subunit amino acid aminotransferase/4-amino-4-deoxychorismate lyase